MNKMRRKGVGPRQLSKFVPPTLEEAKSYFLTVGSDVLDLEREAVAFSSYYGSQGWLRGNGNSVTDWRQAATDWIVKSENKLYEQTGTNRPGAPRGGVPIRGRVVPDGALHRPDKGPDKR